MSGTVLSQHWIKHTRKKHVCGWCGQWIESGSAAHYQSGVSDGDFSANHLHPECQAAFDSITPEQWRAMGHYYEFGDDTRGRLDGQKGPPQFSDTYRGGNTEPYRIPEPEAAQ